MEIICYRINPGIDESLVGDFMVQVQLHQDNMIAACLKSSARYTKLKGKSPIGTPLGLSRQVEKTPQM